MTGSASPHHQRKSRAVDNLGGKICWTGTACPIFLTVFDTSEILTNPITERTLHLTMSIITSRVIIQARHAPPIAVTVFSVGIFVKSFAAAHQNVGSDSPDVTVKVIATRNYVPASWLVASATQDRIYTVNQAKKRTALFLYLSTERFVQKLWCWRFFTLFRGES